MTAHTHPRPSSRIRRRARLAAGTAIAAAAMILATTAAAVPPAATASPSSPAHVADRAEESGTAAPRTAWRTRDPREARASYGDVRRLGIVREGNQVRIRMRYWEGRNEYNPDLVHVDVDTGGGARPDFQIYYDSALSRRLWVSRYEGRRVCTLRIEDKPRYGFNQQVPLRCLTVDGEGRPARARFRVLNSAEDPLFSAPDIVPGGVGRSENAVRRFGPWLTLRG